MDPVDAPGDVRAGLLGVSRSPLERDGGQVDGDHVPPAAGQPDRVGALAGADVERVAGEQFARLGDQVRVGVAAPERVFRPVPLIPGFLAEWVGHVG